MVAGLLADGGNIHPGYAESMLGREKVANTFLGEGIAIPHGMLKDREMIRETGIAVVQVPRRRGVEPGRARAARGRHRRRLGRAPPDPREPHPGAGGRRGGRAAFHDLESGARRRPADARARGHGGAHRRHDGARAARGLRERRRRDLRLERPARAPGDVPGRRGQGLRGRRPRPPRRQGRERQEPGVAAEPWCRRRLDRDAAHERPGRARRAAGARGGGRGRARRGGGRARGGGRRAARVAPGGRGRPACPGSRPRPGSRSARCGISSAAGSSSSARPRTRRSRSRSCAAASSPRAPSCATSTRRSRPSRARARPRSSARTRRSSTTRTSSARPTRRSAAASRPAGRGAR